ncbi:MAG: hypothetical protein V1817_03385 [Candidatus Micrarchaeota archaeon]
MAVRTFEVRFVKPGEWGRFWREPPPKFGQIALFLPGKNLGPEEIGGVKTTFSRALVDAQLNVLKTRLSRLSREADEKGLINFTNNHLISTKIDVKCGLLALHLHWFTPEAPTQVYLDRVQKILNKKFAELLCDQPSSLA